MFAIAMPMILRGLADDGDRNAVAAACSFEHVRRGDRIERSGAFDHRRFIP